MGIQTHGRMRMLWRALIRTASANQPCSHTPQISIASLGFSTLAADSSAPPDSASGNLCTLRSDPKVVFVLGGPGSGKGTQCAKLAEAVGFDHLSAGDLLRAEILSDTLQGRAFKGIIAEGRIVPSEVTVNLLHRRMQETRGGRFLIDGFPRNEENRIVYEKIIGIDPLFVLFFDCSLEEMEARLLSRNQGRIDDNLETIRKRFKVFEEESLPVVEYYRSLGKVVTVNAGRMQQEIFRSILPLFSRIDCGVSATSRV